MVPCPHNIVTVYQYAHVAPYKGTYQRDLQHTSPTGTIEKLMVMTKTMIVQVHVHAQ